MSQLIPTAIRDRSIPPPPVHWHLFENLPAPDLPARKAGESMDDYRKRLRGYTEEWSGRRARPHRSLFRLDPEHRARGIRA